MFTTARQYLATVVVCGLSAISGLPLVFATGATALTMISDATVVRQSDELALFERNVDFSVPIDRSPGPTLAIWSLVSAAIGSTGLIVVPHALKTPVEVATFCGVLALALLSVVSSYFGFFWLVQRGQTPRELAKLLYRMPDALGVVELLPRETSMVVNGVLRCLLGACFALPFGLAALNFDSSMATIEGAVVTLGLAAFYPLAFVLFSQGFLCIRWSKAAAAASS